jgi:hypothetical protein
MEVVDIARDCNGNTLHIGDKVILTDIGDWLIKDLTKIEVRAIKSCIGKPGIIDSIDMYGYVWPMFKKMHFMKSSGTWVCIESSWFCVESFRLQKQ